MNAPLVPTPAPTKLHVKTRTVDSDALAMKDSLETERSALMLTTAPLDSSLSMDNASTTTSAMPTHVMPPLFAPTLKVPSHASVHPASLAMDSLATTSMSAPLELTTAMPMLPARTLPVPSPANATTDGSETARPALMSMSVLPMMLAALMPPAPTSMAVSY